MARFTRVLARGDFGIDVEGVSRAYIRDGLWPGMTLSEFAKMPVEKRRRFDSNREKAQKRIERQIGATVNGTYARGSHGELEERKAFDAKAEKLLKDWRPDPPPLIEPKQGFDSLHPSLHRLYSDAIRLGGHDLGTYNPNAKLPGGGMSDHASSVDKAKTPSRPAMACDIGFDPDTGMNSPIGRALFGLGMANPDDCEYVIVGDKIGFPKTGKSRKYTSGGHLDHAHFSGYRES